MENSFSQWRDSSQLDNASFVISDSEEDVKDSVKAHRRTLVIDESNDEDSDVSEHVISRRSMIDDHSTPIAPLNKSKIRRMRKKRVIESDDSTDSNNETEHTNDPYSVTNNSDSNDDSTDKEHDYSISYSPIKNQDRKRKDISHDYTRENIKELKNNTFNESSNSEVNLDDKDNSNQENVTDSDGTDSDTDSEINVKNKISYNEPTTIVLDSDSESNLKKNSELAISLAKQESNVGNIDPIVAQKREFIVCRITQLKNEIARTKLLLIKGNVEMLPDRGKRLYDSINKQEKEIEALTLELKNMPVQNSDINEMKESIQEKKKPLFTKDEPYSYSHIDNVAMKSSILSEWKELGKKAQETMNKELTLTDERLQDLHGSLIARPSENERAEDPKGLKVKLMPHQQHALAWLLWREHQRPSGGVLADDMGLGKTLTMISLIMTTLADKDVESDSDDSNDEWVSKHKPLRQKGGTLIVCPASLLSQWDAEVQNRCKRGILSVEIYHGSNRENVPKRLARNDMVITTYNILSREYTGDSTLYKIKWKRVILDEAHIIRNHKSKASEAACGLIASKRWALTGTPIQNKELDLYSILKFLKCTPFDDLRVWKRWVDNKNVAGHQRLATVMKTLMLRRTKQELMAKGDLENLPDKCIEEIMVKLDPEEQLVYEKILVYSRTLFAQFLAQRAEKEHAFDLYSGKYDKPAFLSNPNKETRFTKAQNKLLATHADVKTHEILVLLLRLRQICCHPALIQAMLDQEDVKQSGIMDIENVDLDVLSRMNNMSLDEIEKPEEENIDQRIAENLLTSENPVFNNDRISSKMRILLDMVKKILQEGDDKLIIISQWATLLDVVASRLTSIKGATFSKFTGSVAIKDRQDIMNAFNNPNSNPRILLLSLTAGGVGLNLVGANHLLLFDIHWNPQLETQAQDRIYRVGQTKNVYVYKFICSNTIEERIKTLQERKIEIAQSVLSGNRSNAATKLTFNDLKSLFAL